LLKRKEKVAKRERGDKNTLGDHIQTTNNYDFNVYE
jgi:hypothetical protein